MADIGTMQEQLQALEAQLGASVSMVAAFDGELARMRETMVFTGREVNTLSNGISGGLRKAFDGLVFDGLKLNDALKTVANTIVDTVYSIAVKPVTNALGGFLAQGVAGLVGSGMPFAKGGTFSQGKVMPFAKGG
ncbi:MAG: phage tail tape measure protein, partial [Tabrizicola sp.]|nr:phage tail tape measure protein [Tabrizicola sp.]